MLISPNGEMTAEGQFSNQSSKLDLMAATLNLKNSSHNQKGFGWQESNSVKSSTR
jgi:hypothetical protein